MENQYDIKQLCIEKEDIEQLVITHSRTKKTQKNLPIQLENEFWQFNILTYKQVPDWLNARFWANPENWNKFRW